MSSVDLLLPIWESYRLFKDSSVVTKRALKREWESPEEQKYFFDGTEFRSDTMSEAAESVDRSIQSIEDLMILSLYATFERYIIECLQEKGEAIKGKSPEWLYVKLYLRFENSIERGSLDEVFSWFKNAKVIDDELCESLKKTKTYRDWIAHRNPKRKPQEISDPATVYTILSTAIEKIDSAVNIH
ncbi:MAG: hypothetical protein WCU00_03685 [Candidatus Latescibacterota bacterium]